MVSILRPGQRIHSIPGIGVQTSRRAVSSAAWWLAGGAPAPIVVYQPKGAASLAASYINLVNPAYNAAPGVAPTFDTATGWGFNGATQYLTTNGLSSALKPFSGLIRFTSASITGYRAILSTDAHSGGIEFQTEATTGKLGVAKSNIVFVGQSNTNVSVGVNVVVGFTYSANGAWAWYFNGNPDGSGTNDQTFTASNMLIGVQRLGGLANQWFYGSIQAVAIWNTSTNHATWMPAVMAAGALI